MGFGFGVFGVGGLVLPFAGVGGVVVEFLGAVVVEDVSEAFGADGVLCGFGFAELVAVGNPAVLG